jgi:nucleotide-binding universal stress UspA family protein
MNQTMFVLLTGGLSDASVCSTAAVIGRSLTAHLEFYHPRFDATEIALNTPHTGFAIGSAVAEMLDELGQEGDRRAESARACFGSLCGRERVPIAREPKPGTFSACWLDQPAIDIEDVVKSARYRDMIIAARTQPGFGLPADFLERFVHRSGRPVFVAPDRTACAAPETIVVWWKDTAVSARALGAALPLLDKAKRVVVTTAAENGMTCDISELVDELCLRGVPAEERVLPMQRGSITARLFEAAEDSAADLVVMGAYGRSYARETVFGGVTEAVLHRADIPVLLAH